MLSIFYPQLRDCVNSLGVPVDNLSLREAIERIICMAKMRDGKSRLVFSLNEKILFNTVGYPFSRPRHPELLNVLRTSELVMANDFPIVWLSQIIGRPLQQRLPAADLAPLLAKRSAEESLSLFFAGRHRGRLRCGRIIKGTLSNAQYSWHLRISHVQ